MFRMINIAFAICQEKWIPHEAMSPFCFLGVFPFLDLRGKKEKMKREYTKVDIGFIGLILGSFCGYSWGIYFGLNKYIMIFMILMGLAAIIPTGRKKRDGS